MQTGSSETLIGWKSGKTTYVPLWDRMEGAWLWTLAFTAYTALQNLGLFCNQGYDETFHFFRENGNLKAIPKKSCNIFSHKRREYIIVKFQFIDPEMDAKISTNLTLKKYYKIEGLVFFSRFDRVWPKFKNGLI